MKRPHVHLPEPTYPCYLPVLGEFSRMAPHVGPEFIVSRRRVPWPTRSDRRCAEDPGSPLGWNLLSRRPDLIRNDGCPGRSRRIRLAAYGARLERVLGSRPRGFESPILRCRGPRVIDLGPSSVRTPEFRGCQVRGLSCVGAPGVPGGQGRPESAETAHTTGGPRPSC